MLISAPNLDLGEAEDEITSLLAPAADLEVNEQRACEQFMTVLAKVLPLLPGNCEARYWALDDLSCTSANRERDVVTMQGTCNWLSGGEDSDRFRFDVALDKNPTLYSCKFTNSTTGNQVLYVGKTPEGWLVTAGGGARRGMEQDTP